MPSALKAPQFHAVKEGPAAGKMVLAQPWRLRHHAIRVARFGVTLRSPATYGRLYRMNPMAVTRKEAALAAKQARKDKKKAARAAAPKKG